MKNKINNFEKFYSNKFALKKKMFLNFLIFFSIIFIVLFIIYYVFKDYFLLDFIPVIYLVSILIIIFSSKNEISNKYPSDNDKMNNLLPKNYIDHFKENLSKYEYFSEIIFIKDSLRITDNAKQTSVIDLVFPYFTLRSKTNPIGICFIEEIFSYFPKEELLGIIAHEEGHLINLDFRKDSYRTNLYKYRQSSIICLFLTIVYSIIDTSLPACKKNFSFF